MDDPPSKGKNYSDGPKNRDLIQSAPDLTMMPAGPKTVCADGAGPGRSFPKNTVSPFPSSG